VASNVASGSGYGKKSDEDIVNEFLDSIVRKTVLID
jgi:hypothetical protein